jgi:bifunctional DNase/RNase
MYKLVKYITKVCYKDFSTYYLFHKGGKILLPIEIYNQESTATPSIYNALKRIITAVGFSVIGVKIYHFTDNIFYTYITMKNDGIEFDINLSFRDAIEIAKETSSPIFIKDSILDSCGIAITKDMVIKALKDEGLNGYLDK